MRDFTDGLLPSHPRGPDILSKERAQSNVSVDELSEYLLHHNGFLDRQARILPILQKEPLLDKSQQQNLSRPDLYKQALARAKLLRRLADKHGWDIADYKMAEYLVDDVSPYFLHMEMFSTTIREQASDSQRAYWMPQIERWEIIGAYAQTELGHGSNVRGLELEARWDQHAKQFVLHSPALTASKWWNGTLGRTANHAIVVAQLLLPRHGTSSTSKDVEYISYGPHPFIVQVRNMTSHQPLDGVVIGDIGPKYGYATMDNGYMLFDNFRIPHSALLSRYSSVDPDTGRYSKPEKPAVVYGSLTAVRASIVQHARLVLARAVTVAIRYTAIRRQFRDRDGDGNGPELAVLDYPTVQVRILPLLATTFALHYTGLAMQRIYEGTRREIESGNFNNLAHMHSMSSGLKSLCTSLVADGIETCRRALGGHGFGGGSGLIQLNNDYLSKPTVEGDNWMITQQTASYIIKKMTVAVSSPNSRYNDEIDGQFKEYIRQGHQYQLDILRNDRDIVKSFQLRATSLAYNAYQERVVRKRSWNSLLIQLHRLSRAQSQSILVTKFFQALDGDRSLSLSVKGTIWDLFRLFALFTMETESYEFFTSGVVAREQLDRLPTRIGELMAQIRPHAVNLVDSWKVPDYLLDSALGRYDGQVYEDLFNRAHRLNPLNKLTFNPKYWEDETIMGVSDPRLTSSKL
ncbi:acyl-CoA dehydrogenase/oxidase C-terminal [Aspergillus ambiguus]|uniref:acyl-CoA dehydrogenase/oxidase C-terminal n=1 Tax=Aspergillus ambiguus TaxID=176160 RepID=UPI003CCDB8A1